MNQLPYCRPYSTHEAADLVKNKPQSLIAAVCRKGHWCGIKPTKLPNGRLLWPAEKIDALVRGGSV